MLKNLYYSVEFPSTGRSFENRLSFEPGLTAIVGKNEAGKSLIIEMIEYALFGKTALRGTAADYKNLRVELCLDVLGAEINLVRFPKNESFSIGNDVMAVGAAAINEAVPRFLGFGLDVFRIALAANQDRLNDLTEMKPTARAKMVDDLTGMDLLQNTEQACKQEAKQFSVLADALTVQLRTPIEPVPPTDPRSAHELWLAWEKLGEIHRKRQTYIPLEEPILPVPPEHPGFDENELLDYERNRQTIILQRDAIERELASIPQPKASLQDLNHAIAAFEYKQEVARRGPKPLYDKDQLLDWEKLWLAPNQGACPKCGYEFHTPDVPLNLNAVRGQLMYHERWAEPLNEVKYIGPVTDIDAERTAHARAVDRKKLRHKLEQLTVPVERSSDLERARAYNRDRVRYDAAVERYEQEKESYEARKTWLEEHPDCSEELTQTYNLYMARTEYDKTKAVFDAETEVYVRNIQQISDTRGESDGFISGAKVLKNVRVKVKQELAPSLSAAASGLLYSLTNGERKSVVVDQDFNVWVDGQPLVTLSGSGKAVVNLALRIGMGQILTAKVLSIFIGDEIDGSMDSNRAGATHSTFRALTKHVNQVILITHKQIEADNLISL